METEFKSTVCKNLIRLRIHNRYSQKEISEVLEITQTSYNRIESGKIRINALFLFRLAQFYNILVDDFFSNNVIIRSDEQKLKKDFVQLQERLESLYLLKKDN
ncbi:helix-turn-helix transcriptional regulator [Albibacterium sp.]|uniref:helix-turn-helix transcriptional regulator n=1 Tax=Albibacterium sp. TaxID=2952885 RepID=UPI002B51C15A|nr:helix-turn-helix transcriptional regulator [Albibacterium sp.]HUH17848.1 helix-turn-helix transcriptional regulator [Albibacterium sp.]